MPACTEAKNLNILNTHAITLYLLKNCLMGLYLKYYYNAMGTSLLHKINNLIHVLIKNRNAQISYLYIHVYEVIYRSDASVVYFFHYYIIHLLFMII